MSCPCKAQQNNLRCSRATIRATRHSSGCLQALITCCVQAPEKQKECEELLGPMGSKFDHLAAVARLINDYTNPDAADEGPRGQGDEGALDKDIGVAVEFERDSDEDEGGSMEEVMVGLVAVHLLQGSVVRAMVDTLGQVLVRTLLGVGTTERLDQLNNVRKLDLWRSAQHTGTQL